MNGIAQAFHGSQPFVSDVGHTFRTLARFYFSERRLGHTHAMLNGVADAKACVLLMAHCERYAGDLRRRTGDHVDVITPGQVNALLGRRATLLLIDHHCLALLFDEGARKIQSLEGLLAAARTQTEVARSEQAAARRMSDEYAHAIVQMKEKLKRSRARVRALRKGGKV